MPRLLRDGEPKARAAVMTGCGAIQLRKALEQLLTVFLSDADTGILHGPHEMIRPVACHRTYREGDRPLTGELTSVADEVEQALSEAKLVDIHIPFARLRDVQCVVFSCCQDLRGGGDVQKQAPNGYVFQVKGHLAGFDL